MYVTLHERCHKTRKLPRPFWGRFNYISFALINASWGCVDNGYEYSSAIYVAQLRYCT